MTDWTALRYVVVDVEGNGQQPPELVEVATVPIVGGVIGEPVSWLVRPDQPITSFARRIHRISNEDVADCPSFADISVQVTETLKADAVVAHNAHVDVDVLRRQLPEWEPSEVFDTLSLARRLVPSQVRYRLGNLVEVFELAEGLPEDLSPHRATYDALVAARLFVLLATKAGSLEALRGTQPRGSDDEPPSLF